MEITLAQACIDSFFLLLCLGTIYSAISKGLLSEILKSSGLVLGSVLAFQFYLFIGEKIQDRVSFLSKHYFYFFSFLLIFISILIIFRLARLIVTFLIKKSEMHIVGKWLLVISGGFRAALLSSVIIFLLFLAPFSNKYISNTFSYVLFKSIAPGIYLKSLDIYNKLNSENSLDVNNQVKDYYAKDFQKKEL